MPMTINNRSVQEIVALLQAPYPKDKVAYRADKDKRPYFPKEVYFERLDNVIGIHNYQFQIIHQPVLQKVGTDTVYVGTVELKIYTDDGVLVPGLSVTEMGSSSVIFRQNTEKPLSLLFDMRAAVTSAQKECIRTLCGPASHASEYVSNQGGNAGVKPTQYEQKSISLSNPFAEKSNMISTKGTFEGKQYDVIMWKNNINERNLVLFKSLKSGTAILSDFTIRPYGQSLQILISTIHSFKQP